MPDGLIVAGHSVGEVAAWGVTGLLDMRDALDQRKADVVDVSLPPANST
jgi:[acyl-carrier-protein] S-malonyltransferase